MNDDDSTLNLKTLEKDDREFADPDATMALPGRTRRKDEQTENVGRVLRPDQAD
jgi:hypothetical protein